MTSADFRDYALKIVGIGTYLHADAATLKRILYDLNASLSEIHQLATPWWTESQSGALVQGPETLTNITATNGSATVVVPGYQAWMAGCTIQLAGGDPNQNQLRNATTLGRAYAGSTGTVSGVIYGDAVQLPADVSAIMPPVILMGEHELAPIDGPKEGLIVGDLGYGLGGVHGNRDVGTPRAYRLEHDGGALRMRLYPMPDRAHTVQFTKRSKPQKFTAFGTTEILVPGDDAEAILLPIFDMRFATIGDVETRGQNENLRDKRDQAILYLKSLRPQAVRGRRLTRRRNW
jgi:hypothetical protein